MAVLGARKGRRDSWGRAPQKLGGSRPLAGHVKGWKRGKRSPASSNKVRDTSGGAHKGGHLVPLPARAEGKNHG